MGIRLGRLGIAAVATAVLAIAALLPSAASAAATPTYPVGTAADGYAHYLADPDGNPPGVNVPCTPSAAHPRPVVLVEGTTSRINASFWRLGAMIANAGYCVYGLNYGDTVLTTLSGGHIGAMGDIPTSAAQLSTFVDQVLAKTGASKVDIVGWSQGGGPMPRYYIQNLGGAAKVHQLIGLAPSNYGTTFFGLLTLGTQLEQLGNFPFLTLIGAPAFEQQEQSSAFTTALNKDGDTVPGVEYTVIETRFDDVVTPYTNAFLRSTGRATVHNILLQDACPQDASDHISIPYDDNAAQYVLNALGPDDPGFRPVCKIAIPLGGSNGTALPTIG